MRDIRISEAIWEAMADHGRFGESADDVLRRMLGIPPGQPEPQLNGASRPHGPERRATNRLERRIGDGALELTFASGESKRWTLPDRNDKASLRKVVKAAMDWAKDHNASLGQLNAVRKAFTDYGYHLTR